MTQIERERENVGSNTVDIGGRLIGILDGYSRHWTTAVTRERRLTEQLLELHSPPLHICLYTARGNMKKNIIYVFSSFGEVTRSYHSQNLTLVKHLHDKPRPLIRTLPQ